MLMSFALEVQAGTVWSYCLREQRTWGLQLDSVPYLSCDPENAESTIPFEDDAVAPAR